MSIYIFFKQQESIISVFIYALAYYCFYYFKFVFVHSIFNQNILNKAMRFIYFIKARFKTIIPGKIFIFLFAGDDFLTDSYNSSVCFKAH